MPKKHQAILLNLFDLESDHGEGHHDAARADRGDRHRRAAGTRSASNRHRLPHAPAGISAARPDDVVGVLHPAAQGARDRCATTSSTRDAARSRCASPTSCRRARRCFAQLQHFQENQERLALVVDEYGELMGLRDARGHRRGDHRRVHHSLARCSPRASIAWDRTARYVAEGGEPLRELNRKLGLALPLDGPKTLNGLILEHLQDIPEPRRRVDGSPAAAWRSSRPRTGSVKTVRISALRLEAAATLPAAQRLETAEVAFTNALNGHYCLTFENHNLTDRLDWI